MMTDGRTRYMKRPGNSASPKSAKKKPYRKPVLQVYGDLPTITNHVGNTGTTLDSAPHMGDFKTR
jgi:hypothetical protein